MEPLTSLTIERIVLTGYFVYCQGLEGRLFLSPFPARWAWGEFAARLLPLAIVIIVLVSNFDLNIYRHIVWPVLFCVLPMLVMQIVKSQDDARRAARKAQQNQILLEETEKELNESYG